MAAVSRERSPDIDLIGREAAGLVAAHVALVTRMGLDGLSSGHARSPIADNHAAADGSRNGYPLFAFELRGAPAGCGGLCPGTRSTLGGFGGTLLETCGGTLGSFRRLAGGSGTSFTLP